MNSTEIPGDEIARPLDALLLRVRYLASPRPYVEPRVNDAETLATLKPRVLEHFGLAEGDVNGGRKEYVFADDGVVQTNLNVTRAARTPNALPTSLAASFVRSSPRKPTRTNSMRPRRDSWKRSPRCVSPFQGATVSSVTAADSKRNDCSETASSVNGDWSATGSLQSSENHCRFESLASKSKRRSRRRGIAVRRRVNC